MKSLYSLLLILPLVACKPENTTYTVVQEGHCDADTSHRYHYVMPAGKSEKLPLIIVLDPHANGKMAVQKMMEAADGIPCFIAGSDLIRNNMEGFEKAISDLIKDVSQKFQVDHNRLILTGFSGGARMAFEYARNNKAGGLLMCGAGPSNIWDFSCPVYLIAGTTDFNFREAWINPLAAPYNPVFYSDYFRGKHDWPPVGYLKTGLLYLISKTGTVKKSLITSESKLQMERADSLQKSGDYLLALKAAEKSALLNKNNKKAVKLQEIIKANRACATHLNEIESNMSLEYKIGNEYMKALDEKDSTWWFHELDYLLKQIDQSGGNKKDHLMRIKSLLGIMFYSKINRDIRTNQVNPNVIHLLAAYKKAEPENSDVYYAYALYSLKKGEPEKSRKFLDKARSYGFVDPARVKADFPEEF